MIRIPSEYESRKEKYKIFYCVKVVKKKKLSIHTF